MKMQAKDLKVGMTLKHGYYVMVIDSIELSNQKNGTPTIIVNGVAQYTKKISMVNIKSHQQLNLFLKI